MKINSLICHLLIIVASADTRSCTPCGIEHSYAWKHATVVLAVLTPYYLLAEGRKKMQMKTQKNRELQWGMGVDRAICYSCWENDQDEKTPQGNGLTGKHRHGSQSWKQWGYHWFYDKDRAIWYGRIDELVQGANGAVGEKLEMFGRGGKYHTG